MSDSREAFECLTCSVEFASPPDMSAGMANLLSFPCKLEDCCICGKKACRKEYCDACAKDRAGIPCNAGACPNCGSLYVEWISRGIPEKDIYYSCEWNSGRRQWPGSAKGPSAQKEVEVEEQTTEGAEEPAEEPAEGEKG